MQLTTIEASDYGLEENKAKQISDMFKPMLDKMVELEKEYNEIIDKPIDSFVIRDAKELRLRYVKVRTGTATIHKSLKEFYLKGGKFVDGWKNAQIMASSDIEEKLISIEKHYENIENEKIQQIKTRRESELLIYIEDESFLPQDLGKMEVDVWDNYISNIKSGYEAKIKAEKQAEEDRIAKEKADIEDRKRIEAENEKLKKDAEEKEHLDRIETDKRNKLEAKERERNQIKIEAQRLENERVLKIEEDKRLKIEKELKSKKEMEEKAESDRLAKIESELSKGDEEKLKDLIDDLLSITTKYNFSSKVSKNMYLNLNVAIKKLITNIE